MDATQLGYNPEYSETSPTVEQVSNLPGISVIEFGAPWCGHCKAAEAGVRDVMENKKDINHIKIYDGKGKKLGRHFRVKLWPTLILLKDGEELDRLMRPVQASDVEGLLGKAG